MTILDTVKTWGNKKIWGEHSLSVFELIFYVLAFAIMWFNWLGKWSFWIGIAIIMISAAIF
jgi:hypothetical protein